MIKSLIVGGGISDYNVDKIGCILALDIRNVETFIGFGLSCLLVTYLALNSSLEYIVDNHVYIMSLAPVEKLSALRQLFESRLGDLTFKGFNKRYNKKLLYGAYNLTLKTKELFGVHNCPDMKLVDALLLSINIPSDIYISMYKENIYMDISYINSIPLSILPLKCQKKSMVVYLNTDTYPIEKDIKKIIQLAPRLDVEKSELKLVNWNRVVPIPYKMWTDTGTDTETDTGTESKRLLPSLISSRIVSSYYWTCEYILDKFKAP